MTDNGSTPHHVHVGYAGKHGPHDPAAHRLAETRSTPALIGDLINHVTELFRKEVQLFRAEINEKTRQVSNAGVMLAGALVLGLVGLIYLAGAVALGLVAAGLSPAWAVLIVGIVLALVALVMALSGKNKLNASNLAPHRTVDSLSKDARMAREKTK
jgi:hypothetical protein